MSKLLRTIIFACTLAFIFTMYVHAKDINVKVGQAVLADISADEWNKHYTDNKDNVTGYVDVDISGDKVYVHGVKNGVIPMVNSDTLKVDLTVRVSGKQSKYKKYNKIDSVIKSYENDGLVYTGIRFQKSREFNSMVLVTDVKNADTKIKVINADIVLYDKNKNVIAECDDNSVYGSNYFAVKSGETYESYAVPMSADSLGITNSEYKKIKYWGFK